MRRSQLQSLTSSRLALQVAPSEGGRITSLIDRWTETEWLYSGLDRPPPMGGTSYADGPRGGFDECLPSVSPCVAPGWPGGTVGDHGDFWWREWNVVVQNQQCLVLRADYPDHPLSLVRSLEVTDCGHVLRVAYELRNKSSAALPYLYSAHPLFSLTQPLFVEMPLGQPVRNAFGRSLDCEGRSFWPWVQTAAGSESIDLIRPDDPADNYKVFVKSTGVVALRNVLTGDGLRLLFDPMALPWVGVCVNRRTWPHDGAIDQWVAIEPTTAPTDDLTHAQLAGWSRDLAPGAVHRWTFKVVLEGQSVEIDENLMAHG